MTFDGEIETYTSASLALVRTILSIKILNIFLLHWIIFPIFPLKEPLNILTSSSRRIGID